ncbi:MAG: hypothetical protein ACRDTR_11355 [Rubrobacter sp.]
MEEVRSAHPGEERKLLLYLSVAVQQIIVEKGNDHRHLITSISIQTPQSTLDWFSRNAAPPVLGMGESREQGIVP